ncbi:hypothetical protein [Lyngbya sp. PCC 8106]|uniref:hypothetical protein n=1 Tax=Lyngbya sp. (strain PCC 8106) TaxID=313612 RepID=UPI0000EA9A27|nr:hypothetical protein [Lyngbya sp. PCC 8106]EAW34083.1 hypothetical protein L8106_25745 [Lyngbya sp. PCC 8106]
MSEQNSTERPLFQINEKMYQQLLKWQQKLEQSQPENQASPDSDSTENPNPRGTQTNQNDH